MLLGMRGTVEIHRRFIDCIRPIPLPEMHSLLMWEICSDSVHEGLCDAQEGFDKHWSVNTLTVR